LQDAKPHVLAASIPGENPPGWTMPQSANSLKLDLYNVSEADIRLKVNYVCLMTSVPLPCSDNQATDNGPKSLIFARFLGAGFAGYA
jgi:hypothetical protein